MPHRTELQVHDHGQGNPSPVANQNPELLDSHARSIPRSRTTVKLILYSTLRRRGEGACPRCTRILKPFAAREHPDQQTAPHKPRTRGARVRRTHVAPSRGAASGTTWGADRAGERVRSGAARTAQRARCTLVRRARKKGRKRDGRAQAPLRRGHVKELQRLSVPV